MRRRYTVSCSVVIRPEVSYHTRSLLPLEGLGIDQLRHGNADSRPAPFHHRPRTPSHTRATPRGHTRRYLCSREQSLGVSHTDHPPLFNVNAYRSLAPSQTLAIAPAEI